MSEGQGQPEPAPETQALTSPMPRDSAEENAQLETALQLSASDQSAQSPDGHEEPEPALATPRSILKKLVLKLSPARMKFLLGQPLNLVGNWVSDHQVALQLACGVRARAASMSAASMSAASMSAAGMSAASM